jgi:hypothetical protein
MADPHIPDIIDADIILPSSNVVKSEDEKDQQARRWAGVAILGFVAILCGCLITFRPEGSESAKNAWHILFAVIGAVTTYLFQSGAGKQKK